VAPPPDERDQRTVVRIVLGVTGASGAAYAGHALRALTRSGVDVGLCVSDAGCQVIGHEVLGMPELPGPARRDEVLTGFLGRYANAGGHVEVLDPGDLSCRFASGSSGAQAALLAPCSMSTLANVAHGTGSSLIHRAADVMLKERRPLVVVPRETPLSAIHLENMLALTRAGAVVLPAMPALYTRPATVEDMVDFVVSRALDHLGVANALAPRWGATHGVHA
ncbi:MAG: UbiX family flavin prenyltransferase, partial [Actinomycetota bacterium]